MQCKYRGIRPNRKHNPCVEASDHQRGQRGNLILSDDESLARAAVSAGHVPPGLWRPMGELNRPVQSSAESKRDAIAAAGLSTPWMSTPTGGDGAEVQEVKW